MAARAALALVLTLVGVGFYVSLFVRGLHQRKVISFSNLHAERDRSPAVYWIYQAFYAVVAMLFPVVGVLLASGYKFGRDISIDRPFSVLFGGFFLFAAVVIGATGVVGLRTGVAVRSSWVIRRPPPSRKSNQIRYWSLEAFYLLAALMFVFLGALMILVNLK